MKSLSTIKLLQSVILTLISSCVLISHSSTSDFFSCLSPGPGYDLVPIAALKNKAGILRARNLEAGFDEGGEEFFEPMST